MRIDILTAARIGVALSFTIAFWLRKSDTRVGAYGMHGATMLMVASSFALFFAYPGAFGFLWPLSVMGGWTMYVFSRVLRGCYWAMIAEQAQRARTGRGAPIKR